MRTMHRDAPAAAHHDARHECNVRFAVTGNGVVQNIFDAINFMHEGIVAPLLVNGTHVSSSAEGPLARSANDNGGDGGVNTPCLQLRVERLDQAHVDDVENGRPVEYRDPDRA